MALHEDARQALKQARLVIATSRLHKPVEQSRRWRIVEATTNVDVCGITFSTKESARSIRNELAEGMGKTLKLTSAIPKLKKTSKLH